MATSPNQKLAETGAGGTGGVLSLTVDPDGVAWIVLDVPGEAQNTLNPKFAPEFEAILMRLERDPNVKCAVLASGKPDSFVAGADVSMLESVKSARDAEEISRRGHAGFARLAALRIPVVAAIRGACLGGGLELALACHARVAADDKKTVLGLPEVMLGLIPGGGGTQRLPALIGIANALDLMLTGKQVKAKKARALGLVDEVCAPAIVRDAAAQLARAMAAGEKRPDSPAKKRSPLSKEELQELALEDNPVGRAFLFKKARDELVKKTGGHYPAPLRALEALKIGIEKGPEKGYAAEAERFGQSVVDAVAKNLISIFFAQTALKKDLGIDDAKVQPRPVKKIGVLGGGLMGGGIAYVAAATAGIPVRVKDKDDQGVARGLAYVRGILDERVKRRSVTSLEANEAFARLSGATDYSGFKTADLVIEAVFEDVDLKKRVLRDVEAIVRPDCVFASNTSTIPITEIASASSRPETVLGMHFFSPVHKMPLLEVIVTKKTAPWVTATAVACGKKLGKTVIVVNDGPGFYTSRILGPYVNEAAYLLTEGVPIEVIDKALVRWGFPVGPIMLLDEVGIDVAAKAGKVMHGHFAERMTPPPILQRLIDDGRAGRKNKKGFYTYGDDKKKKKKEPDASVYQVLGVKPLETTPPAEEIAERVALQMVNEAARCLGEGILRSPRDGDVGAIFGLGFPPFHGGPFRWVDATGVASVVSRLDHFREIHGPRFEAAPILREYAAAQRRFHPA
jgi:3-hydroxyacyl-CoA dehydrogenase / enoyl-CoA hydratase / 3-hydroxybutyryl-CoA epimerase